MGLPSLPLTWWAEEIGGSTDLSDYQIAHMPPAAVCAGAARRAAKYKEYALLRSVFCRTACQHAADKPAHRRAVRGNGSGDRSGSDSLWAFLRRITFGAKEFQRPWVLGGVLFHISFAVERNMAAGGIHAGRGCSPQSENAQRAAGDAGPYAVRHCRAVRGSGSGSCRRVPEPVIARHPRGTWERKRGETYKRFDAEPFYTVVGIGQGKSKNRWFLAAFFSIFLSLLKEIWPPEA